MNKKSIWRTILNILVLIIELINSKKCAKKEQKQRFKEANKDLKQLYKDIDAKKEEKSKDVQEISNYINNRF